MHISMEQVKFRWKAVTKWKEVSTIKTRKNGYFARKRGFWLGQGTERDLGSDMKSLSLSTS